MTQEREIMYINEIDLLGKAVKALPAEYRNRSTMLELFEDVNPDSDATLRVVVANKDLPAMIFYPGRLSGQWDLIELDAKKGGGYL